MVRATLDTALRPQKNRLVVKHCQPRKSILLRQHIILLTACHVVALCSRVSPPTPNMTHVYTTWKSCVNAPPTDPTSLHAGICVLYPPLCCLCCPGFRITQEAHRYHLALTLVPLTVPNHHPTTVHDGSQIVNRIRTNPRHLVERTEPPVDHAQREASLLTSQSLPVCLLQSSNLRRHTAVVVQSFARVMSWTTL